MPVAEGTRAKTWQMDAEGINSTLQEILRKLERIDSQLVAVESATQSKGGKALMVVDDESESVRKSNSQRGGQEDRVSRQTKVEFPGFDGTWVQEWKFHSERFFELEETPTALKVNIASVYLSGLAVEWHYAFISNRKMPGPVSWEEYSTGMMMRFGSNEVTRPIVQLKRLMEEHSFFEYVDEFVSIVSKVDLPDEDQVALFVEELKKRKSEAHQSIGTKNSTAGNCCG